MLKQLNAITIKNLFISLTLSTASVADSSEYAFTPLVGYRISDSLEDDITGESIKLDETSSFGFLLSTRRDYESSYDFLFSRQDSLLRPKSTPSNSMGVRLDYYHIGGTVNYEENNLHPFASGGLGLTRITASNQDLSAETRFSLSVGGGLKFPVTKDVGLRFEGRAYGTAISGSGSILCANGGCAASFSGSLFLQFEVSAGLSIAF